MQLPRSEIEADDCAQKPPKWVRNIGQPFHPHGEPFGVYHCKAEQAQGAKRQHRTWQSVKTVHEAIEMSQPAKFKLGAVLREGCGERLMA